ncbi:MAG: DUF6364 family protein [Phormidesmis sp. CAN_BIN36]|nr:DUF6364 family protein [Phormidesmis sp. CAN_BIN36]
MQSQLIVDLDDALIKKAENWAQMRQISLSEAIALLLQQLPSSDQPLTLSPWTQSLVGLFNSEGETSQESQLQQQYIDYLEEKYR